MRVALRNSLNRCTQFVSKKQPPWPADRMSYIATRTNTTLGRKRERIIVASTSPSGAKETPPLTAPKETQNLVERENTRQRMCKAILAPLNRVSSIRRQCAWRFGANATGTVGTFTGTSTKTVTVAGTVPAPWLRHGISSGAVLAKDPPQAQSQSPLGKIGVAAALAPSSGAAKPTLWNEFALRDRVALVSGANRGLGLEMALALVEAGARAVYCVDLPERPGDEWVKVAEYVRRMVADSNGAVHGAAGVRVCGREGPEGDVEGRGGDRGAGGQDGRLCGRCGDLEVTHGLPGVPCGSI